MNLLNFSPRRETLGVVMTDKEKYRKTLAWWIYCFETRHDLNVVDYWDQLSPKVQKMYLEQADREALS